MALNIENNVEFKFGAGLTSGTLLLNVKAGKETLLPSVPFKLTLVQFDAGGAVMQREIVNVTNKASNILTITRAVEACPKDDSAIALVTTPYDFDEGDSAFMTLTSDMIKKLETNIDSRVLQSTYDAEKNVFSASSTGTDDYVITDTSLTTYNDGQPIRFRVDVANTGIATLGINALAPKALKKEQGTADLITGDIKANGIVTAVYNSVLDVFQFVGQEATVVSTSVNNIVMSINAGENLTQGDALYISTNGNAYKTNSAITSKSLFIGFAQQTTTSGTNVNIVTNGLDINQSGLTIASYYYLQGLLNESVVINSWYTGQTGDNQGQTLISSTSLYITNLNIGTNLGAQNYNITCNVYTGVGGTLLGSDTIDVAGTGGSLTIFFTINATVASSTYYVQLIKNSADAGGTMDLKRSNGSVYANGTNYISDVASTNDLYITCNFTNNGAPGTIGLSPVVNSVKVGRAISATKLLINTLGI